MVTHDLLRVRATTPPSHTLLRVAASGNLQSTKLHTLLKASASGAMATEFRHRLLNVVATAPIDASINTIVGERSVEPGKIYEYLAVADNPGLGRIEWRVKSGPAGVKTSTGAAGQLFMRVPPTLDEVVVVLAVKVVLPVGETEERTANIAVLPSSVAVRTGTSTARRAIVVTRR